MKNTTYIKSIKCAVNGIYYALRNEKNFKYHFVIALIFLVLNIINKIDKVYWIGYVITVVGVISSEMINTSIEHTLDIISKEKREDIKIAKDIGAGMVLCWGIGFFIIEGLALIK